MTMIYSFAEAKHLARQMAEKGLTEDDMLKVEPVMNFQDNENRRIWREIVASAQGV